MTTRHKWPEDKSGANLTCARCGMSVKSYQVKRGNLPPCLGKPQPFTQLKLEQTDRCRYHKRGLLGGNERCLACGKTYTDEEKRRFEPLRQEALRIHKEAPSQIAQIKPEYPFKP